MNKKVMLIGILVIVFIIIGVVIYKFTASNKQDALPTTTTTKTGLSNLDPKSFTAILGML